jgi:hypothetical protein
MKIRNLTRTEVARHDKEDPGDYAERLAGEEYGYFQGGGEDVDWYDRARDSGAVIEVKSAEPTINSDEYRASGRFRIWKDAHQKLTRYDRQDSGFYVFVLVDVDTGEGRPQYRMIRKNPADVGRMIGARGGWGPSGHESQEQQYKLPIDAIF